MNDVVNAEKNALSVSYDVRGARVDLDVDFVRNYLVRGKAELVTNQEVVFFINLCKMQKLNPLTGSECYLIKYSPAEPAQMVVGKSAYMRRAFEHPDYICKEDGIVVQRGNEIIQKEGCCLYPGEVLLGGWCRVCYARNGKERTAFKEVSLSEYNKGQANWKTKPASMINKVAISQCVREAFPKDYEGLYSEEEMIASGAVLAEVIYDNGGTEKVVEVVDKPITQEERQAFLDAIKTKFKDSTKANEVYTTILNKLGLRSSNGMLHSDMSLAMKMIEEMPEETVETVETEVETAQEE